MSPPSLLQNTTMTPSLLISTLPFHWLRSNPEFHGQPKFIWRHFHNAEDFTATVTHLHQVTVSSMFRPTLILACIVQVVRCYPSGNVFGSCSNMRPSHGGTAQQSTPPFTLTADQTSYSDGVIITGEPHLNRKIGLLVDQQVNITSDTPEC